jgi:hypothetical protein
MLLRTLAVIYGILFLVLGILGFIPNISPHEMLFWVFNVNPLLNVIHLITGIIAVWIGAVSVHGSKTYFVAVGIIYVILGILGFGYQKHEIFEVIANNMADAWMHLVLGVIGLYFGFGFKIHGHAKSRR